MTSPDPSFSAFLGARSWVPFGSRLPDVTSKLCQKPSWAVPRESLSCDTLQGEVGGTGFALSPVREAQAICGRCHGAWWGCCPRDDAGIHWGGGRWSLTQIWKLLSQLSFQIKKAHGALMTVYTVFLEEGSDHPNSLTISSGRPL